MWMGLALLIESRLWIAGVVQQCRDRSLADRLLRQVRACAQSVSQVLVCVDGWGAYPKAIVRAFREKVKMTSGKGRCSLQVWPQLLIGQVIKKQRKHRTIEVKRTLATRERSQLYEPACTTQEGARKSTPPSLNASMRRCAKAWLRSPGARGMPVSVWRLRHSECGERLTDRREWMTARAEDGPLDVAVLRLVDGLQCG